MLWWYWKDSMMLQFFHCVSVLIVFNISKTFHSPCVSVLLNFSCVRSSSQCGSSTIILPATKIVRLITHRRPTMKYKPNLWWIFWHRTYYEQNDAIMLVFPLPHIHTAKSWMSAMSIRRWEFVLHLEMFGDLEMLHLPQIGTSRVSFLQKPHSPQKKLLSWQNTSFFIEVDWTIWSDVSPTWW